ncbi:hypothetical protein CDAR_367811 [Caerostris darwini]|uniref:Uncharacterized protein n=1 Tax=Caerostris darwini TaxID=1538125 RepID=A0AAV4T3H6_9ARAC|nr:hypothetical protein CDAR_367811 [Caerostris darwini]
MCPALKTFNETTLSPVRELRKHDRPPRKTGQNVFQRSLLVPSRDVPVLLKNAIVSIVVNIRFTTTFYGTFTTTKTFPHLLEYGHNFMDSV